MRTLPDAGVPLDHYRQHGAGVRLTCLDCLRHRDLALEPVIARLAARGVALGAHRAVQGKVLATANKAAALAALAPVAADLRAMRAEALPMERLPRL